MAFDKLAKQVAQNGVTPRLQSAPLGMRPANAPAVGGGYGEKVGGMVANKAISTGVNAVSKPLLNAAAPAIEAVTAPLAGAIEGITAPIASGISSIFGGGAGAAAGTAAGTAAAGTAAGGAAAGLAPLALAAGPAAPVVLAGGLLASKLMGGK